MMMPMSPTDLYVVDGYIAVEFTFDIIVANMFQNVTVTETNEEIVICLSDRNFANLDRKPRQALFVSQFWLRVNC